MKGMLMPVLLDLIPFVAYKTGINIFRVTIFPAGFCSFSTKYQFNRKRNNCPQDLKEPFNN